MSQISFPTQRMLDTASQMHALVDRMREQIVWQVTQAQDTAQSLSPPTLRTAYLEFLNDWQQNISRWLSAWEAVATQLANGATEADATDQGIAQLAQQQDATTSQAGADIGALASALAANAANLAPPPLPMSALAVHEAITGDGADRLAQDLATDLATLPPAAPPLSTLAVHEAITSADSELGTMQSGMGQPPLTPPAGAPTGTGTPAAATTPGWWSRVRGRRQ